MLTVALSCPSALGAPSSSPRDEQAFDPLEPHFVQAIKLGEGWRLPQGSVTTKWTEFWGHLLQTVESRATTEHRV